MSQKVFLKQLNTQLEVIDDEIYLFQNKISHVWIQGIVVHFQPDGEELVIDDGTDCILVVLSRINLNQVPGYASNKLLGSYIMIQGSILIGEDTNTQENVIFLEARLMSLLSDSNLETLWSLEVQDSFARLTNQNNS